MTFTITPTTTTSTTVAVASRPIASHTAADPVAGVAVALLVLVAGVEHYVVRARRR